MTQYAKKYVEIEIDREDMLSLTRRMTPNRNSITRVAGAYMDQKGFIEGTFNTRFLKLSIPERVKNLEIAKAIPFADTNRNLKRYRIRGIHGKIHVGNSSRNLPLCVEKAMKQDEYLTNEQVMK